jgi:hypothetical protein
VEDRPIQFSKLSFGWVTFMANDAQKILIANNWRTCRIWLIVSAIVTAIAAFSIFYLQRNTPKTQNTKTFLSGLACTIGGFILVLRAIRVYGEGRNISTKGNLSGNSKQLLDIVGVGLFIEFFAIWWHQALFLFLLIPAFMIYELLKKIGRWLSAF